MTLFLRKYWAPAAFGATAVVAVALGLAFAAEWPLGWVAAGAFGSDFLWLAVRARLRRPLRLASTVVRDLVFSGILAVAWFSVGESATAAAVALTCLAFVLFFAALWISVGRQPGAGPLDAITRRLDELKQEWT